SARAQAAIRVSTAIRVSNRVLSYSIGLVHRLRGPLEKLSSYPCNSPAVEACRPCPILERVHWRLGDGQFRKTHYRRHGEFDRGRDGQKADWRKRFPRRFRHHLAGARLVSPGGGARGVSEIRANHR